MVAVGMLLGCSRTSPPRPEVTTTVPAADLQFARPGIFALACETECADELADLTAWRDDAGAIAMVTVQGTPAGCSHPPLRFLAPDGGERAIPLVPVTPGSPEAQRFAAIRATQTEGLHAGETMKCRQVKH
jgi:hypothetical protein